MIHVYEFVYIIVNLMVKLWEFMELSLFWGFQAGGGIPSIAQVSNTPRVSGAGFRLLMF